MTEFKRKKIVFVIALIGLAVSFFIRSTPAAAFAISFPDIKPVGVAGEDLLGLLGPQFPGSQSDYKVNIWGYLYTGNASSSNSGDFGTVYEDAGYFEMHIKRYWQGAAGSAAQELTFYLPSTLKGDVNILNNCSTCPTELDRVSYSYSSSSPVAAYFLVHWIYPSLFDYVANEYLQSLDIIFTDYDGNALVDESLPAQLSLDSFDTAYAFMRIGAYPDEDNSSLYLLDLKGAPVPEPSTMVLILAGLSALMFGRKLRNRVAGKRCLTNI